ncbi:hypothetical protein HanXRQr2_Chr09g0397411 [Helianthus annuus]|uniref:Uncharacterized protein n=1 Tax=Helianthus annuus TaxID=4232 RepID=A0A251TZC0_HELAN|nr:hypothetical protein HanXRQr2_Chr09g0397411 [Helianthus annuus]KAJ0893914.1 hypothetical protein HanPSC8_Chr09g0383171 [Helianthus annuus]
MLWHAGAFIQGYQESYTVFFIRYLRFFLNHHVYCLFRRSYYYNLDLTILITCSNFRGILLLESTSLLRFRRAIDSLQKYLVVLLGHKYDWSISS